MDRVANHVFHLAVVGPAFLYVGLANKETLPDYVFHALLTVGLIVLAYHVYRAYTKFTESKSAWVNLIHIFLIAPLLLWIGYMKKDAGRKYFEMLMMLGFAAMGYHGLYLVR
jgi:hypothetical protein